MKLGNSSKRPVSVHTAVSMSSSPTSSSSSSSSYLPWFPTNEALAKLFVTGATVGPVVDSLHNQCLLEYHKAPISIPYPVAGDFDGFLFCSSWTVPPLLGIAYVVLGGILPRITQKLLAAGKRTSSKIKTRRNHKDGAPVMATTATGAASDVVIKNSSATNFWASLQTRALLAVATTALIIKFSEVLETHELFPLLLRNVVDDDGFLPLSLDNNNMSATTAASPILNIAILAAIALLQWAILDRTGYALFVATIAAIGGPLSELPFVAADVWQYLPQAADYFPLQSIILPSIATNVLGENYQELALSSITGPCYFAVTMDAIALGRWFDATSSNKTGVDNIS